MWSPTIFATADVRSWQKSAMSCRGVYTVNLDARINRTCGRPRPAVVVGLRGAFALVSRPSWDGAAARTCVHIRRVPFSNGPRERESRAALSLSRTHVPRARGTMRRRTSGWPKFSLLLFLLLPIPAFSFDCCVSCAECLLTLLRLLSSPSPQPFASRGCGSRLADFFKIVPLRPRLQRRGQHGADGSGSPQATPVFCVCRVARLLSSRRVRASEIGPSSLLRLSDAPVDALSAS